MWWNEYTCRPQITRMFYGHFTRNLGLAGVSALLFWCKFPCELFGMRACLGVGVIYLYVCGGCGWRVMYDSWWGWRTCACEPKLKYCHISWTGNGIRRDFGSILRKIHVYLLYHYSSLANKVVWNCEIVGSAKENHGKFRFHLSDNSDAPPVPFTNSTSLCILVHCCSIFLWDLDWKYIYRWSIKKPKYKWKII